MRPFVGSLLLVLLAAGSLAGSAGVDVPEGWRLPGDEDMEGAWAGFKGQERRPYHVRADFNGDGMLDDAFIVLSKTGSGWALFVSLGSDQGESETLKLVEDSGKNRPQSVNLEVAKPGKYETACGKGYWPCERDEPTELELLLPALHFRQIEGAASFFWWDKRSRKFHRTWMSD